MLPRPRRVLTSPSTCARQTAEALGLTAAVDVSLADWDLGRWSHRTIAELLRGLAQRMEVLRELPMGAHDARQMTGPEPVAAFESVMRAERELLELLQGRVQWNAAMLAVMHAGGQAKSEQ